MRKLLAIAIIIALWTGLGAAQANPPASGAGAVPFLDPGSLGRLPGIGGGGPGIPQVPINLGPSQTGTYNGQGYSATNLNLTNSSVNQVFNVMAPPYNALGDGITDDFAGMQQAIWDATTNGTPFGTCISGNPPESNTVYIPKGPSCFSHSAPLRITCGNMELKGDLGSALCQNYVGDALIQAGSGAHGAGGTGMLPYTTSLVTGTANQHALVTAAGPITNYIDLARFLYDTKAPISGSPFATGFNIAEFDKLTSGASNSGQILSSTPSYPGLNPGVFGSGAFSFTFDGANGVVITVRTVAGLHTFATCPAETAGTVYEHELNWSGTAYTAWQGAPGGTAVQCGATFTSSNPMVVGPYEEIMEPDGGPTGFWPDGSSNANSAFVGAIDAIRFFAQSVHTAAYTVPNAKWTEPSGASTYDLLVLNFDTSEDGTQYGVGGYGGTTYKVYFTLRGSSGTVGSTSGENIHDLELCAQGTRAGQFGVLATAGLFATDGNGSVWNNLKCSIAYYAQAEFDNNDFFANDTNWKGSGGHIGLIHGPAWNNSIETNAQIDITDTACEVYSGGGGAHHLDNNTHCVDRGILRYNAIENQSSGVYIDHYIDQEVSSPNFIADMLLNQPAGAYTFQGGVFSPGDTGAYIQQDNGGAGSTFVNPNFTTFGAPPELFNITNGLPSTALQVFNKTAPTSVPLSNLPQYIYEPGITPVTRVTVSGPTTLVLPVLGDSVQYLTMAATQTITLPQSTLPATAKQSQFAELHVCQTGRVFTDGVENTTTTLTSATAAFVSADVGRAVSGTNIPAGTVISSVTNATTVILSLAETGTASGVTITLGGYVPTFAAIAGLTLKGTFPTPTVAANKCDIYGISYDSPTSASLTGYMLNE